MFNIYDAISVLVVFQFVMIVSESVDGYLQIYQNQVEEMFRLR